MRQFGDRPIKLVQPAICRGVAAVVLLTAGCASPLHDGSSRFIARRPNSEDVRAPDAATEAIPTKSSAAPTREHEARPSPTSDQDFVAELARLIEKHRPREAAAAADAGSASRGEGGSAVVEAAKPAPSPRRAAGSTSSPASAASHGNGDLPAEAASTTNYSRRAESAPPESVLPSEELFPYTNLAQHDARDERNQVMDSGPTADAPDRPSGPRAIPNRLRGERASIDRSDLRDAVAASRAAMPDEANPARAAAAELPPAEPPRTAQEAIEDALRLLREELRELPSDARREDLTRREVALRLLRIASLDEEDWNEALSPIGHLGAEEKEAWQHLLYAIKEFHENPDVPRIEMRAGAALLALRQAEAALRNLSMLQVRNLKLCTKVTSFGRYDEFPEMRFLPGQPVIVYAEVDNFSTEAKSDGYETALEGTCEIYNANKEMVYLHKFGVEREISANRRRDFFFPYPFRIPAELTPGQYSLTLTIKDVLASKFDQQSILFTVESKR